MILLNTFEEIKGKASLYFVFFFSKLVILLSLKYKIIYYGLRYELTIMECRLVGCVVLVLCKIWNAKLTSLFANKMWVGWGCRPYSPNSNPWAVNQTDRWRIGILIPHFWIKRVNNTCARRRINPLNLRSHVLQAGFIGHAVWD